jgi:uncharacterized protein (DUF849 family)
VTTPVLIKACVNGAREPGSHPALPVTPSEVAAAARACRDAGAGVVHVHVRNASGEESLSPSDVASTVEAVRVACPGLPIGVSTGAWIVRDTALRLEMVKSWTVLPDFASVNWSEDGSEDLARLLMGKGIAVEAGLFTPDDARALASSSLAPHCLRALIEVRDREGATALNLAVEMDGIFREVGLAIRLLHHGFGEGTWSIIEQGLALGRDVRIGLEDTFTLRDGSPAPDNAALVRGVVAMAGEVGRLPSA